MKLYRYMSINELEKYMQGKTIEGQCDTSIIQNKVCFFPEISFATSLEESGKVDIDIETFSLSVDGIVNKSILVEFDITPQAKIEESYADYSNNTCLRGRTVNIKEVWMDSYSSEELTFSRAFIPNQELTCVVKIPKEVLEEKNFLKDLNYRFSILEDPNNDVFVSNAPTSARFSSNAVLSPKDFLLSIREYDISFGNSDYFCLKKSEVPIGEELKQFYMESNTFSENGLFISLEDSSYKNLSSQIKTIPYFLKEEILEELERKDKCDRADLLDFHIKNIYEKQFRTEVPETLQDYLNLKKEVNCSGSLLTDYSLLLVDDKLFTNFNNGIFKSRDGFIDTESFLNIAANADKIYSLVTQGESFFNSPTIVGIEELLQKRVMLGYDSERIQALFTPEGIKDFELECKQTIANNLECYPENIIFDGKNFQAFVYSEGDLSLSFYREGLESTNHILVERPGFEPLQIFTNIEVLPSILKDLVIQNSTENITNEDLKKAVVEAVDELKDINLQETNSEEREI